MPARIDQWLTIKDFRPGIKGRVTPGGISRRPGEALGVAAPDNTYGCQALPDGSLAPMPKNISTFSEGASTPMDPTATTTGRLTISGYHRLGPIQTGDESHIAFEAKATSDSKRRYYWTRVRHFAADQVDTLMSFAPGTEGAIGSFFARPTFFDNFRANASDATLPGVPGVVAGWFAGGGGSDRVWNMFPDPTSPTQDVPQAIGGSFDPNPQLSHQGRSVAFDQGSYAHGANSYVWTHNEDVWFTKANLTSLDVSAAQTFGAENASGYMAAVSANHQEMLCVKLQGGGLLIRGDLKNPTVLRLPSLPPISRHIPSVSPAGVVLLDSNKTGAWLWTGGETAENISRESIDGSKFFLGLQAGAGGEGGTTDFLDYTGKLIYWYDWVLFPNNWAWNWKEDSWWRLENPANVRFMHYAQMSNTLYAAPAHITAKTDAVEYAYAYDQARQTYRWTSQPMPIGENAMVMIRELVLVATGAGDVTITFTRQDGSTEAHTFTINSTSTPTFMRDNCDVNCQAINVQIDVTTSGTNVPIIHELRMGYQNDKHYPMRTA